MRKVPVSQWILGLSKVQGSAGERHFLCEEYKGRCWPVVIADGSGIVCHAGTALLRELAERTGLCVEYSDAAAGLRSRGVGMIRGRCWWIWR